VSTFGGSAARGVWGWIVRGVVFVLTGGVPLVIGIGGAAEVMGSHRAYVGGRVLVGRPHRRGVRGCEGAALAGASR